MGFRVWGLGFRVTFLGRVVDGGFDAATRVPDMDESTSLGFRL